MKTIVDGKAKICKLLGEQKPRNINYRIMKYILFSECEDGTILHNVITGQLVLLSDEESQALLKLPCSRIDGMSELIRAYFIVPIDFDERMLVSQLRALLKRLAPAKGINGYTILPTTYCNARCFYCYESDFPRMTMNESTASRLVQYMITHKGKGPLRISWFGGEPLVAEERIDQICRELHNHEIEFRSSMVSNGYLFNESIAEKAIRDWNVKTVQITLDGTEEVYNRTKAFIVASSSPYQRVLSNIRMLLSKGINVGIRLNLDQHNEDDLMDLIGELQGLLVISDNLDVYVHTLFENEGFLPIERDADAREGLYKRQIEMNSYLEDVGLRKRHLFLPSLKENCCTADGNDATCVYPDGHLFKCEHTGVADAYGCIEKEETDETKLAKFKETVEFEQCSDCPLYPSCILLKECNGLQDHNQFTCKHEVESRTHGLKAIYKTKTTPPEIESDASAC